MSSDWLVPWERSRNVESWRCDIFPFSRLSLEKMVACTDFCWYWWFHQIWDDPNSLWTDSIHVNLFAIGICDVVCLCHQERATWQYGEVLWSGCWCFKKARHGGDRFAGPYRFLLSCRWLAREGSHFVKQIPQVKNQTFWRKGEMLGFGFFVGWWMCILYYVIFTLPFNLPNMN